jgi:hypothetical protein
VSRLATYRKRLARDLRPTDCRFLPFQSLAMRNPLCVLLRLHVTATEERGAGVPAADFLIVPISALTGAAMPA